MQLKQKGYWRKFFGLKGHLYYFASEVPPRTSVWQAPAFWTAMIAATSTITTAIFAYQNYKYSARNYIAAHPAALVIRVVKLDGEGTYGFVVRNEGGSSARKLRVFVYAYALGDPSESSTFSQEIDVRELPGHSSVPLRTTSTKDIVRQLGKLRQAATFSIFFDNEVGDFQPERSYCAEGEPNTPYLLLRDCSPITLQEQSPPRSRQE